MTPGIEISLISGIFLLLNSAVVGTFAYLNNKSRKTDKAETNAKIEEVHKTVNSGLTKQLEIREELGKLKGKMNKRIFKKKSKKELILKVIILKLNNKY